MRQEVLFNKLKKSLDVYHFIWEDFEDDNVSLTHRNTPSYSFDIYFRKNKFPFSLISKYHIEEWENEDDGEQLRHLDRTWKWQLNKEFSKLYEEKASDDLLIQLSLPNKPPSPCPSKPLYSIQFEIEDNKHFLVPPEENDAETNKIKLRKVWNELVEQGWDEHDE